jgi:hypothetical protein
MSPFTNLYLSRSKMTEVNFIKFTYGQLGESELVPKLVLKGVWPIRAR